MRPSEEHTPAAPDTVLSVTDTPEASGRAAPEASLSVMDAPEASGRVAPDTVLSVTDAPEASGRANAADAAPELLSPAGSMDALRAAVQNGADAVYLGYGRFHARVRAAGFTPDEFRDAIRYCHLYGVRVYLTLNTLLTDREIPAALEQARDASRLGIDAVLVQDWGLLSVLRACLPDLPLHASTQMSAFTSGAVRLLRDAGCTRIVAARECSREDVAALCRNGAEIETFVHGALCMCRSGQCAMSAVIGGRSGNRGRCAQPCRLPCGVGKFSPDAHALSLKDMNLSAYLEELRETGVACLKIEGRLKRPEYVAVVTSVYARLLRERRQPSREEAALLERVFSRSGFTDAYWRGERGPQMFGTRPDSVPDTEKLFQAARATYENDRTRKVRVTFACAIHPGAASRLTVSDDDGNRVTVTGPVPEAARNRPLTPESVSRQLSKTGGGPYVCDAIRADVDGGLSLPVSALNALRRDALDALSGLRTAVPERREFAMPSMLSADVCATVTPSGNACAVAPSGNACAAPRYTVSVCRPAQLVSALLALSPERIYFPLEWFADAFTVPDWLRASGTELCAILPRVWRDRDESALAVTLQRAKAQGVTGTLAGNIGHLPLVADAAPDLRVYGDFGLNVTNAHSAVWLRAHGLESVCVSFELRTEQIRDMAKPLPFEAILYGRLPLMITENYPGGTRPDNATTNGGGTRPHGPTLNAGTRPQGPEHALIDRTGAAFPLLDAFGGRVEIQNSRPLWLADRDAWRNAGLSFARLRFTTESPDECADVARAYLERRAPDRPFTRGLYERGVE